MKLIIRIITLLIVLIIPKPSHAQENQEITLTVSSDGPTKDEAVKNALRLAIEQAYGAFVSANTTILNDELVKDEIVTISNGAIKEYKIISDARKPDGSGYVVTTNATVSLPHLVTYARNHGSECEFAGNSFGMDLKLFKLQKENELKALYNAIPMIVEFAKNNMQHVLQVEEPKIVKLNYNNKTYVSEEFSNKDRASRWKKGYERFCGDIELIGLEDKTWLKGKGLCNKPITRPDGKPSYQKDDVVLKGIEELANDEIVALRFNIKWLPVDEKNTLYDYIENFLSSLSLDHESFWKYRDQGHDMCTGPSTTFGKGLIRFSDFTHFYFRNSMNDINGWFYTLQEAISKVKNNFQIIDNTGEISDFAPQKIADIEFCNHYDWTSHAEDELNSDVKQRLKQKISDIGNNKLSLEYFDPICGILSANSAYEKCYSFPDKLYKAYREEPYDPRRFCYGGKGIFSRLFTVNTLSIVKTSEGYFPAGEYAWSVYPAWEVVTLIPSSDIGKYSSFKIVKE